MAFGKNPANRADIVPYGGSFAQKAAMASRKPPTGRNNRRTPYWVDQFRPSESLPDTIRLVPGEYKIQSLDDSGNVVEDTYPWFRYTEHYHGGLKKGAVCSAGPFRMKRGQREPCYGCDLFWEDYTIRRQKRDETGQRVETPNRVSMRDMYVFNVLDLGSFYETDQVDRNGRVRMNQQGAPYQEWRKLTHPNDPEAIGKKQRKGRLQPWAMGTNHFNALRGYAEHIAQSCAGCGTRGDALTPALQTVFYACGNPDCRTPLIDCTESTLSPEQIQEVISTPQRCSSCGIVGFLREMVSCEVCAQNKTEPKRAWIFDVDMQIKRQRSPDSNQSQLIVLATSVPKDIDPEYLALANPIDLPERFKPTPLDEQHALWGEPAGKPATDWNEVPF